MVQFTPSFFSPQKGFVITQLNGAGCSNFGNFPVLPINGAIMNSPFDMNSFATFSKINNSTAGYLSVEMNDPITSKLTVTKRSGIAKFIFKDSNEGSIIIGSGINSSDSKYITEAMIKITSNSSCEGFTKGGEFVAQKSLIKFILLQNLIDLLAKLEHGMEEI